MTRFRWVEKSTESNVSHLKWYLDDIYIGNNCQSLCNGRGDCQLNGTCRCDSGYSGLFYLIIFVLFLIYIYIYIYIYIMYSF